MNLDAKLADLEARHLQRGYVNGAAPDEDEIPNFDAPPPSDDDGPTWANEGHGPSGPNVPPLGHSGHTLRGGPNGPTNEGEPNVRVIWAWELPETGDLSDSEVWGPMLCKGVGLWSGVPAVGKTTLEYRLAVEIERGGALGGIGVSQASKVLLCDLETPTRLQRSKMQLAAGGLLPNGVGFWPQEIELTIERLHNAIVEHNFGVVFLDTLSVCFPVTDENDAAEAERQMIPLCRLANELDVAIIAMAHVGQGEPTHPIYKTRGSTARPAKADLVVNLEHHRQEDDVITLDLRKSRYVEPQRLHLRKIGEGDFGVFNPADDVGVANLIGEAALALERKLYAAGHEGLRRAELFAAVGEIASERTLKRALDSLLARGRIKTPARGVYLHTKSKDQPPVHDDGAEARP